MTGLRTAVVTVVHGRHQHLLLQERAIAASTLRPDVRCVVAMDDDDVGPLVPNSVVVECPSAGGGLPLARARNLGAACALQAGADLLIFLDVDCLPGEAMFERYVAAHRRARQTLLAGPVTYLDPPPPGGYRIDELARMTNPHPARPAPPSGELRREGNYDLFWSLSFALPGETWRRIGGFTEEYTGYGGEDTDFAAVACHLGVPLLWVGGADAYHQHHPVSDPPVEHLHDIVRNARVFRRRWGRWPMPGWLDEFENRGLLVRRGDDIAVTGTQRAAASASLSPLVAN